MTDQVQLTKSSPRPHIVLSGATSSARERHHLMTMFSMKPKFNLAEFLAVPAPLGAARSRGAKRRGMQFQTGAASEDATRPTPPEDSSAADKAKE